MDHYTVVTSLKRLDKRFTQELTEADRKAAFNKFKRVYAQQMSKLASEMNKRQKIQQNLNQVNEKEQEKVNKINEQIRRKMEKNTQNRQKHQQSIDKEIKMLDDNWKRKMEEITQKNREKSKEAIRKAERMRKQTEQFLVKKKSYTARDTTKEDALSQHVKAEPIFQNVLSNKQKVSIGHYILTGLKKKQVSFDSKTFKNIKTQQKKLKMLLPDLKKVKFNSKINQNMTLNDSLSSQNKNDDIKLHLDRTTRTRKEQQYSKFQKAMQRLQKIQKTRLIAQENMQLQIKQAKKIRQLRQSPQVHAANRQRSIDEFHSKSKKRLLQKSLKTNTKELAQSLSKSRLSQSIEKHLQAKKRIQQEQFNERQSLYQLKKQKLKHGKINRMIKQAINQLKQKTLNERQ